MRQVDASNHSRSLEPRHVRRLLRRAILPPLILLTILAGVLLWQVNNLLMAHRAVEHSNRVIEDVDRLEDHLLAMQSALRGYAVTRHEDQADAYERARQSIEGGLTRLLGRVGDNPSQARRVEALRPLMVMWTGLADVALAQVREEIGAAERGASVTGSVVSGSESASDPETEAPVAPPPAPAAVAGGIDLFSGPGKQVLDELRAKLNGLLQEETTLRDTRSLAVRRSAAQTVLGGVALAALLGVALAALARRQMVAVADTYGQALELARNRTLQVQRSESLLRLITDTLPSLVAFIDANEHYLFTNRAYEQYRGLSSEQVRGRHVREVLGPEAHDRIRPQIEQVLHGRRVSFDTTVQFARAGQREVHVDYSPHTDAQGKVSGFVVLMTDMTEHVTAQRELARSEERYRHFVRQSSEGIWRFELGEPIPICAPVEQQIELLYKHAYLAECNDAMAQMYGLDRAEQIIGARLGDLLVREDPLNVAYLKAFVHSGYRLADGESVERDARGGSRYFVNNLVGFIEEGKLIRAWGTQRDITDRKKAEEERDALLERERAARTEAERAGRVKDEFLSTLSHELRTPLNAILGWAQLLRRSGDVDETDMRQGLETIERNSRTQAQLIDDLLDMSRIIAGKVRLEIGRVEVLGVIDAAIDTVRHAADAKGVKLYKHANALTEVSVMGDAARLQQMVWNLLSNAIKFTPTGGRVDVTLSRFGEQVEITVADTGAGIEPAFLPYVFDRFRQADSSTTRQHGGLGLGLAIVRQMAEMHGGTVQAHSDGPGHGATFRIHLPVASPAPAAAGAVPPVGEGRAVTSTPAKPRAEHYDVDPTALSGVRVLVVDDEPDALALLRRQLEDCDGEVHAATNAPDALRILGEVHPHVVVSDIGMPEHDGFWLMEQMRARESSGLSASHTPAVALTAFARPEDRMRALEVGFERHLPKPVEPAELVMVVAALAGPRLSGSR